MSTSQQQTKWMKGLCSLSCIFLSMLSMSAEAIGFGDKIRLSGFGSISESYSDSDSLGFRSSLAQDGQTGWSWKPDSLIGLQLDSQLTDSLDATLQFVGRDRINNDLDSSVEWAYLTYRSSDLWNVRVGRVAFDSTLIGSFGAVAYAYDWVRPPTEFYSQIPIYSFDGAELARRFYLSNSSLELKLFGGYSSNDYQAQSSPVTFKLAPIIGIAARYESNGVLARLSFSHSEFDGFYNRDVEYVEGLLEPYSASPVIAETLDNLDLNNYSVNYYSAGVQHRFDNWTLMSEASYLQSDASLFLSYFAAYMGVSHRIGEYSLFGFLSHGQTTDDVYQIPSGVNSNIQQIFNVVDSHQSTVSLGSRWDITNQLAIKFQWDRSFVKQGEALLWSRSTDDTPKQNVDVFTLSLNFIF
ncbi:hypothetical protein OAP63_05140 [Vibrio sp.]|nr:hypothetical protein [Vibrio sp.]